MRPYEIVLADPPRGYANRGRGAADNHYPTMTWREVAGLDVTSIAARDSVLFLWATWPFLPESLSVMARWGFGYKTCAFVWVKHHEKSGLKCVGGGFWTRANTEFCLLGVRGDIRRADATVRQLVETLEEQPETILAPRGRHSAKPPEVRDRVVKLMGDRPRIELFARERSPGWDAWGNEIESDFTLGGET